MGASLNAEGDGWSCTDHPDYAPSGMPQRHALNSLAKHTREFHDPSQEELVDLAATIVLASRQTITAGAAAKIAKAIQERGYTKAPF